MAKNLEEARLEVKNRHILVMKELIENSPGIYSEYAKKMLEKVE